MEKKKKPQHSHGVSIPQFPPALSVQVMGEWGASIFRLQRTKYVQGTICFQFNIVPTHWKQGKWLPQMAQCFCLVFCLFETLFHYVAKADLNHMILLPQLPEGWDYRLVLSCPTWSVFVGQVTMVALPLSRHARHPLTPAFMSEWVKWKRSPTHTEDTRLNTSGMVLGTGYLRVTSYALLWLSGKQDT